MRSPAEDSDDCWSYESEALFRAARSDNAPSASDRERVRKVLAQRLADPVGAEVVRQWGAKSARLLQLGVGLTVLVAASLAIKHSHVSRSHRAEPSAMQLVAPPGRTEEKQPMAADTQLQPSAEAASSQDERPLETVVQSSATRAHRAPSVSRPSRSAVNGPVVRESASEQGSKPAAIPPPPPAAARGVQAKHAGARTVTALASSTDHSVADGIDPRSEPVKVLPEFAYGHGHAYGTI